MAELAKVRTERRAALEREKKLADERDALREDIIRLTQSKDAISHERDTLAALVHKKETAGAV